MAIERMKAVWLFAPHAAVGTPRRGEARNILDCLAHMGLSHISDCGQAGAEDWEKLGIARVYPDVGDLERRVQTLREIHETFTAFHKTSREFLENFITTPVEVQREDVRRALAELDVERMHTEVKGLERRHDALVSALQRAKEQWKALADLKDLRLLLPGARDQRRTAALLGTLAVAQAERLKANAKLPDTAAVHIAARVGRKAVVQVASLASDRDAVLAVLRDFQFALIEPDEDTVTLDEYLVRRRDEVQRLQEELEETREGLRETARANCRDVEMTLGYWEERLNIANAAALVAESKRTTILRGYVREKDLDDFQRRCSKELPEVGIDVRDPTPDEAVPVSLKNSKLLAPAQFAVSMFGMPNYFTFDPTLIVFFNFTIFFGICFGDAVYGLALIAIGWSLARKYHEYPTLRQLFALLAYAGVPTFIVGVLTGSWAGSLLSKTWLGDANPFLAANNPLVVLSERLAVFDMMDKLMVALVCALMIGVANQLIGMVCLSVSRHRKGDRVGAVLDSVFWFFALPASVVLAATLFMEVPAATKNVALGVLGASAVGLILTQGRKQKSLLAKFGIGVVSLYGVAGTYGFSSFLNDVLSYSRLLALGLATSIIGIAFNILANMARFTGIKILDFVLVAAILILGHSTNFFLSVLGAFVHSVRLIFVEFFGRFYQADAPAFAPIGTWTGRIRVIDAKTVWSD